MENTITKTEIVKSLTAIRKEIIKSELEQSEIESICQEILKVENKIDIAVDFDPTAPIV